MDTLAIQLPDIDRVDFNDPIEVESYVGLMVQAGNEPGALMPGFHPTAEWDGVRRTAKEVTRRLEALFPLMSPAQKMMSERAYDMAHRIAYCQSADPSLLNRHLLEAFEAKIHGDRSVDEYVLYGKIDRRIFQCDEAFFGKPQAWTRLCLHDWFAARNKRKPAYDQICRTTILLEARPGAYINGSPEPYKEELFACNRHYLDRTYSNVRDLMALDKLLTASLRYLSREDFARYRAAITDALIAHPDTNRFYRKLLRNKRKEDEILKI